MAVDWTPLPAALSLLAVAAIHARIGDLTAKKATGAARLPAALLRTWWVALAIAAATQGFANLLAAMGLVSPAVWVLFLLVSVFALCVGLWGFMVATSYMLTGRRSVWAFAAFYAAVHAGLVALVLAAATDEVQVGLWGSWLVLDVSPFWTSLAALALVAPPLTGAWMCLQAASRVPEG
ncbi:MAG TPA: hypothetical protein VHH36_05975, partial [Candidatus Thermoplasmatota archaeon]|nr:hypothetical protein [Candidatus Thermoplasmatota archaeon]